MGGRVLPANHDAGDGRDRGEVGEGITRSEERQRIARELHDSTSQLLVVLQRQLSQLKGVADAEASPLIVECEQTIHEIREQIRSLNSN